MGFEITGLGCWGGGLGIWGFVCGLGFEALAQGFGVYEFGAWGLGFRV